MDSVVVIVADDDAGIRAMVSTMLRDGLDAEAIGAADGEHALRVLRHVRARLLLTDLEMPHLDGLGLIAAARAEPAWRGLPVVAMSANPRQEAAAREAGADAFLPKPFELAQLLAAVEPLLRRKPPG